MPGSLASTEMRRGRPIPRASESCHDSGITPPADHPGRPDPSPLRSPANWSFRATCVMNDRPLETRSVTP